MHISRLLTTIKKPTLYEKGNAGMWEDDHISRHLLELHLNQECDAASRKRITIEKTVRWIEKHLNNGEKSILDLGCGPGLYCELLAEHGHRVTGIDFSNRSIAYARQSAIQKDLKIDYLQQNYLELSYENRFDLVIMIFCDFDVLVPFDRTRLLENIYRALKPGGLFIFDTLNQKAPAAMKIPGKSWEVEDEGFWKNEPYLALSETFHYEEAKVILQQHIVCTESDQHSVYRFWTHYYPYENLASILNDGGFTVDATQDDLLPDDGSGTHDMVTFYVARKK
jgi:SAM-dependent methyltransferase